MCTAHLLTLVLMLLSGEPASSSHHHNESASLHQILANVRQIDLGSTTEPESPQGDKKNHTLSFVLPCSYYGDDTGRKRPFLQDSTASVLAAKALAKTVLPAAGTVGEEADPLDSLAWDLLDAVLFPTQDIPEENAGLLFQALGILPKYWYFAQEDQQQPSSSYYLEETRFPHWSLFRVGDGSSFNASQTIQSSQRLSALPLQASLLWDMLLVVIPPQPQPRRPQDGDLLQSPPYSYNYDQNKDWWDRVHGYYQTIYQHHEYLHEVVMRGCKSNQNQQSTVPCYNLLHPWESLVQPDSPVWETALQTVLETMERENWTLPFEVPSLVQESYDFPSNPKVYNAMMYIFLEGWNQVNLTKACPQSRNDDDDDNWCPEEALFNSTQFAMLDVGYAAILSQADADLAQLGWVLRQVLPDNNVRNRLDQQMQSLEEWSSQNSHVLQELLWYPPRFSYFSRYYSPKNGKMEWLEEAVSNNLIPFWNTAAASKSEDEDISGNNNNAAQKPKPGDKDKAINDEQDDTRMRQLAQEHMQDLSLQLLHRQGNYSFDCGPFPLWSHGGCDVVDPPPQSTHIQPLVNHLIGNGLLRGDGFHAFGTYVAGQSLELMRHGSGGFGETYRAVPPFDNLATQDACGRTCTLTAAVVYNFQVPDPARTNRLPLPPIRESWVITLITFELLVAFSIGVSCLVLSFNLVRKLRDYTPIPLDEEDAYDNYDSYYDGEAPADEGSPQHYDSTGTSEPQSNGTETAHSSFFSSIGLN